MDGFRSAVAAHELADDALAPGNGLAEQESQPTLLSALSSKAARSDAPALINTIDLQSVAHRRRATDALLKPSAHAAPSGTSTRRRSFDAGKRATGAAQAAASSAMLPGLDAAAQAYIHQFAKMKVGLEGVNAKAAPGTSSISRAVRDGTPTLAAAAAASSPPPSQQPQPQVEKQPAQPLPHPLIPANFRSHSPLQASSSPPLPGHAIGEMTPHEVAGMLDWLFGPVDSHFNHPAKPLDDSASAARIAADEKIRPDAVEAHRRALMEHHRSQGIEMGLVSKADTGSSSGSVAGDGSGTAGKRGGHHGGGHGQAKGRTAPSSPLVPRPSLAPDASPTSPPPSAYPPLSSPDGSIYMPLDYCLVPPCPDDQPPQPHASSSPSPSSSSPPSPPRPFLTPPAPCGPASDPLDVSCPIMVDPVLRALACRVDAILAPILPSSAAVAQRGHVVAFAQGIVRRSVGADSFPTGSTATRLFLPASDVDMTTFIATSSSINGGGDGVAAAATLSPSSSSSSSPAGAPLLGSTDDWFVAVNKALCVASAGGEDADGARDAAALTDPGRGSSASRGPPLVVRDVSFINADVRLVRCSVDGLGLDLSANQAAALAAAALIESADRWIGRSHIFKRSVVLAKAWCELESGSFTASGTAITGSGGGGLSSHALTIMMLALFNSHPRVIRHPLHALLLLFEEYADWPWGSQLVTILGPRHLFLDVGASGTQHLYRKSAPRYITNGHMKPVRLYTASCCSPRDVLEFPFDVRNVNILDPVAHWNNLGRSVSRWGVHVLEEGLRSGRDRLRYVMRLASKAALGSLPLDAAVSGVECMFNNTTGWYGRGDGWREDVTGSGGGGGPAAAASTRANAVAAASPASLPAPDPLLGDSHSFNAALTFSSMLTSSCVSGPGVAYLAAMLIRHHGPLPVGEIGKALQEVTGNPHLPAQLKERYGGLKRFLELIYRGVFLLDADSHPVNPIVRLAGDAHPLARALPLPQLQLGSR